MRKAEARLPQFIETPAPSARETWTFVRQSPRFDDFTSLIDGMLDDAREAYIEQPASEFNRGKVMALRQVVHFLKTGETP
jgi:hypothetical protein